MLTFLQLGRYGRLCNQMFQIASTIGIATRHGYEYGFPEWKNYDHKERFNSDQDISIQNYFKNRLPGISLPHDIINNAFRTVDIPWGYHDTRVPNEHISFAGHMQSEKYFEHCPDLIRHYFKFDESLWGEKTLPETLPAFNSVGIHVRRGDYDNNYHPFTPLEYYVKCISEFPQGEGYAFIVFSDEPDRAKELFKNIPRNFIFMEGNHYVYDLYLMTLCKHFITCNSTYGWWGAWLIDNPDKKIFIPQTWFGPSAGGIDGADLVCPNWTVV